MDSTVVSNSLSEPKISRLASSGWVARKSASATVTTSENWFLAGASGNAAAEASLTRDTAAATGTGGASGATTRVTCGRAG